jgi:hypothetical protein
VNRKMASLGNKILPNFLIMCLILRERSSNIVDKLQMIGAKSQIKDLGLLVRYSFHPLLDFLGCLLNAIA